MRSFARVVQAYMDAIGASSNKDVRRRCAQLAQADLSELFSNHTWRFFEREYDENLWGTETITISSVSGTLVTITGTTSDDWVDQDVLLGDSSIPHRISRINSTSSFIIDPDYDGSSISSGTTATVRQVRIALPTHFGSVVSPVKRDTEISRSSSPEELVHLQHGSWSASYTHSVHKEHLLIWPAEQGRLTFRYRYSPENVFEYLDGTAHVPSTEKDLVIGTSTLWTLLPSSGDGSVFEAQASVARGFAKSYDVVRVIGDDELRLGENYVASTYGSEFEYVISTDLDMPPYMDQWVYAKALYHANKRSEDAVARVLLTAYRSDNASAEPVPNTAMVGVWARVTGSRG